MTFFLAIPAYLVLLYLVARVSERYTPPVWVGGLLLVLAALKWLG